jgi:hypothetical protein
VTTKAEKLNDIDDRLSSVQYAIQDAVDDTDNVSHAEFDSLIAQQAQLRAERKAVEHPESAAPPAPQPAPVAQAPQPVEAFSPEQVARRLEDATARIEEADEERRKFKPETARYARAERAWKAALVERDGIRGELKRHNAALETEAAIQGKIDRDARTAVFDSFRGELDKLRKQGADRYKLQDAQDRAVAVGQALGVVSAAIGGGALSTKPPSAFPGLVEDVARRLELQRPGVEQAVRQRIEAGDTEFAARKSITRPTPPPQAAKPSGLQDDPRFGLRDNAGFFGGR